jgi:ribosomal protein S18 acetylase RimI-like enzyme
MDDHRRSLRIRTAQPEDAADIERVRSAGWRVAYRGILPDALLDEFFGDPDQRQRWMSDPASGTVAELIAEADDAGVVGWVVAGASARDADSAGVAEIRACYVSPDAWGRGAGRALMDAALQALQAAGHRDVVLWVLRDNARARGFYAACGFGPDGAEMVEDYGTPVTSVRYRRPAPGGPRAR